MSTLVPFLAAFEPSGLTEGPSPFLLLRYIGGGADAPSTNVFANFWRSEIIHPEKKAGNITCVVHLGFLWKEGMK